MRNAIPAGVLVAVTIIAMSIMTVAMIHKEGTITDADNIRPRPSLQRASAVCNQYYPLTLTRYTGGLQLRIDIDNFNTTCEAILPINPDKAYRRATAKDIYRQLQYNL